MQNYTQSQPPGPSTTAESNQFTTDSSVLLTSLAITLAVLPLLGILAHKKYRVVMRQRRIKALERAWRLSPKEKKF